MFENLLGNDDLKETLGHLRTAGRVPHAMIFAGPDGVGKLLFALEMARSYVCRVSDTLPCGTCPACVRAGEFELPASDDKDEFKKVIFTNHPDVGVVLAQKRFILVDAIRDLENEAHFRPYEGVARTFIVDDADKLNDAASNALLKTLEEPAATTRIILVTSRPDTLFTTIRSRCQVFRFAPVRPEQIARLLMEKRQVNEPDARFAARVAEGSVGRAISLDIGRMRERRAFALDVLRQALLRRDRAALLRASEKLAEAKNKDFFDEDLYLLAALVRDIWGLSLGGDVVHADIMSDLVEVAEHADPHKLAEVMNEIESIRERFAVNINKKFAADDLFLKMAA